MRRRMRLQDQKTPEIITVQGQQGTDPYAAERQLQAQFFAHVTARAQSYPTCVARYLLAGIVDQETPAGATPIYQFVTCPVWHKGDLHATHARMAAEFGACGWCLADVQYGGIRRWGCACARRQYR